ncbi:MAG TPA: hypothetical protein DHW82_11180 [Spirochaetia bacterium]|nr:MAG: hypothetical protein A2Y41_03715 [Spirochaetes bacterium GWB1_36_13]HCL57555.1 hypothetical protein [Spirochaetia bacterium]
MIDPTIFNKNIDFLNASNPVFAQKIAESKLSPETKIIPAKKQGFYLEVSGKPFNSRIDPIQEALRLIEAEDYSQSDLIITGGIGLGYLPYFLAQKYPDKIILTVEQSWEKAHAALWVHDFTPLFKKGKFELVIPESPENIKDYLKSYGTRKVSLLFHRPSYEENKDFYENLKDTVKKFISTKQVNIATLNRFEKLWFKNMILNMSQYIRFKGANSFFDAFHGKPVFLIGAGPSLSKQIPLLKKIQNQYIFIAVNTSLPFLIQNDIIPDFVLAVDPQDKIYRYFIPVIRNKLPKYPILIAEPTLSPKIIKNYPGKTIFCNVGFLKNWVEQFAPDKGELEMGGSVITAAFTFAIKTGANPIIFLGTDMSYSENTLHFRGAELEKEWLYSQNKFFPQDRKQYFFMKKIELIPHQGFYEKEVYTDVRFITYINWLENQFQKTTHSKIINSTEGGIRFQHIVNQPLEKTLDEIKSSVTLKENIDKNIDAEDYLQKKEAFFQELEKIESDIPKLKKTAEKGIRISEKLYRLIEQKKQIDKKDIDALSRIDQDLSAMNLNEILGLSIQTVIHQVSEDFEETLEEKEKNNKDLKTIKYSLILYRGILESADFTINQIQKAKKY